MSFLFPQSSSSLSAASLGNKKKNHFYHTQTLEMLRGALVRAGGLSSGWKWGERPYGLCEAGAYGLCEAGETSDDEGAFSFSLSAFSLSLSLIVF